MFVFDEKTTRRIRTQWGSEVKKRLIDKNLRQKDLVEILNSKGFSVNKAIINHLLYGIGASARGEEIKEISKILEIPFDTE